MQEQVYFDHMPPKKKERRRANVAAALEGFSDAAVWREISRRQSDAPETGTGRSRAGHWNIISREGPWPWHGGWPIFSGSTICPSGSSRQST